MEKNRISEPSLLVFVSDKHITGRLLDDKEGTDILKLVKKANSKLDKGQRTRDVCELIAGLGRDDKSWDVDRRDATLLLLSQIDFSRTDTTVLKAAYTKAIKKQNKQSDPLGSVYSLLEAGSIIAPFLKANEQTRTEISNAWDTVNTRLANNNEWATVAPKIKDIMVLLGKKYRDERNEPNRVYELSKLWEKDIPEKVSKKPRDMKGISHQQTLMQEMWNSGKSTNEIASEKGKTPHAIQKEIYRLRKKGYHFEMRGYKSSKHNPQPGNEASN